jgi:hypothetical protein
MALYRYVASKDELLDLVRESLWERLDVQTRNEVTWRSALRGIARGFRELVRDHPAAPVLLATGSGERRAERRICDAMLASFRSAGFDPETAEVLYQQFSHFVLALVRLDSVERREGQDSTDGFELGVELFLGGVATLRSKR